MSNTPAAPSHGTGSRRRLLPGFHRPRKTSGSRPRSGHEVHPPVPPRTPRGSGFICHPRVTPDRSPATVRLYPHRRPISGQRLPGGFGTGRPQEGCMGWDLRGTRGTVRVVGHSRTTGLHSRVLSEFRGETVIRETSSCPPGRVGKGKDGKEGTGWRTNLGGVPVTSTAGTDPLHTDGPSLSGRGRGRFRGIPVDKEVKTRKMRGTEQNGPTDLSLVYAVLTPLSFLLTHSLTYSFTH